MYCKIDYQNTWRKKKCIRNYYLIWSEQNLAELVETAIPMIPVVTTILVAFPFLRLKM
jgi:hypothetical protein